MKTITNNFDFSTKPVSRKDLILRMIKIICALTDIKMQPKEQEILLKYILFTEIFSDLKSKEAKKYFCNVLDIKPTTLAVYNNRLSEKKLIVEDKNNQWIINPMFNFPTAINRLKINITLICQDLPLKE